MLCLRRALPPRVTPSLYRRPVHSNFRTSLCRCTLSTASQSLISCTTTRHCTNSTTANSPDKSSSHSGAADEAATQNTTTIADLRAARDGYLKTLLREKRAELAKLDTIKDTCDEVAQRYPDRKMRQLFLFLIFQAAVLFDWTYIHFDWNLVEPITYLVGYSATWIAILWYGALQREFSYEALRDMLREQQRQKLYAQYQFDLAHYEKVKAEVATLVKVLRSLEPL